MQDWRSYQSSLTRKKQRRIWLRRGVWLIGMAVLVVAVTWGTIGLRGPDTPPPKQTGDLRGPDTGPPEISGDADAVASVPQTQTSLTRHDLRNLFSAQNWSELTTPSRHVDFGSRRLQVTTTVAEDLQQYLTDRLMRKTSRYLAIVVMEPDSGRILAMVTHNRPDPRQNVCTEKLFPAASIFKIVAAASVLESVGLRPESRLGFEGSKHTLYKAQLRESLGRHANHVTLEEAFADSVNPVFGRIGAYRLGRNRLLAYASAFGFNHEIDFDLPTAISHFEVSENPYQWAELASGFNKTTTLSALHGAMIAAAIYNDGVMLKPWLVDSITTADGRLLYQGGPETMHAVVGSPTADMVAQMMQATIREGTGRKTFRGYQRDEVLGNLVIGGKTGSYGSNPRFDWFVGFGADQKAASAIAVSVIVAHQDYIGTKSGQYARMAISRYFQN